MKKVFGNISGLRVTQITRLENLYDQRTPPEYLISDEMADIMCRLSAEIRRQIGILVNRRGKVTSVFIGDYHGLVLPDTSEYRVFPGRLKGIRCIHTHLKSESLSNDDLTDLSLLRLDMMAALTITPEGAPHEVFAAHILPSGKTPYHILSPFPANCLNIGCLERILAIESELSRLGAAADSAARGERALLVSVSHQSRHQAEDSMIELEELAISSGLDVAGSIFQHRRQMDSRFLTGAGKLQEITLTAVEKGATLVIFDQELNASQIRSIADQTDLKIIDRTQLILDIFAQRAQSREGKLQVELAQLKYLLPRLVAKNTAMSRLTGGIGGRGPGETKLEINRRRARERILRLEKSLAQVVLQRRQQKSRRRRQGLPVISIIGYTNAGKSTLLNTLTHSQVVAEQRLFATLDPSSRRLRFPKDVDVIITDTVGFIRDLPQDLQVAFRATLEELESADLLLHVIDISNPRCEDQIQSVEVILENLGLNHIPVLRVLNKMDAVSATSLEISVNRYGGIPVCARDNASLQPLVEAMSAIISRRYQPDATAVSEMTA
jgi:GTP-binding protein HflX